MRIGVITDIHIAPAGTPVGKWINPLHYDRAPALLEKAQDWLSSQSVDAVAILGDLANFGDEASIAQGVTSLNKLSVPVLLVSGNHDTIASADQFRSAVQRSAAEHVSIASGTVDTKFGVPIVAASDVLVLPAQDKEAWRYPPHHVQTDSAGPLVVLMHFPLLVRDAEINAAGFPYAAGFDLETTGQDLLSRTDPSIVLHGHLHVRQSVAEGPVLQLGFASLIEPPHQAAVVEITPDLRVQVDHHSLLEADVDRMPVLSPDTETFVWSEELNSWQPSS